MTDKLSGLYSLPLFIANRITYSIRTSECSLSADFAATLRRKRRVAVAGEMAGAHAGLQFLALAGVWVLLLGWALTVQGQTTVLSIVVSPANPQISTTQTQQFTALSGTTVELQGVLQVANGEYHTCALLAGGTVECWGDNTYGELGNGTTSYIPSSTPAAVSGLSGATAIAAGLYDTCALLAGGTVECWGYNNYGELGDGNTTDSSTPVPVSGLSGAIAIAAGVHDTCALLAGGTVECWGDNTYGELGNGTTSFITSSTPAAVSGLSGATAITAGEYHVCALLASGTVECWGDNTYGELGNGTTSSVPSSTPVAVGGLSGATAITAAGGYHTCALLAGGTVECWGYNADGELGNGTITDSGTPVPVSGLSGATAIAAGADHTCALLAGGAVECWGDNSDGELGNGTTTDSSVPVAVSGLSGATAITAAGRVLADSTVGHTCALLAGGTVECWGDNTYGELGNGTATDSSVPVTVIGDVLPGAGAVKVTAGLSAHTCVLLAGGTVECWGDNTYGELGNGTTTDSSTPVPVSGLSGAIAIAAGAVHTCALLGGGTVECWGDNTYGELGNGTTTDSSTSVPVSGLNGATAINAEAYHVCALLAGGTVECWGDNTYGELGNGTTTNSSTPVAVSGLSGAIAIDGGGWTCALLAGGTVECWGNNANGQLGNGTTTNSSTPVAVSGLSGAIAIAAGGAHNCALLAGGTVECWGDNSDGELGNGTTTSSTTPVATAALVVSLDWTSGTTSVATIDPASGLATPASPTSTGSTLITATYGALSNNTTLTVGLAAAITSADDATFIEGTAGSFTVTTMGTPTPSLSESGILPGGVSFQDNGNGTATLFGTPSIGTGGTYPITITAQNGVSPSATQSFTLTVVPALAISAQPQSQSIAPNGTATLSVTATGTGTLTYQWYVGVSGNTSNPIAGATGSTFTTPALTANTSYWVQVTESGPPVEQTNSSTAAITVVSGPAISAQPQSQSIAPNGTATLSVTATGTGTLTYQWYVGVSGNTSSPVAGATNSTFTTPALTATTDYWVQVSASGPPVEQTNSNTAAITVVVVPAPAISVQPLSQSVVPGQTATLSVTATGTGALTYQWYSGLSGNTANPIAGATNSTFTTPALTANTSYWVQVSESGPPNESTESSSAVVVVGAVFAGQPEITNLALPQNVNAPLGSTETLSCTGVELTLNGNQVSLATYGLSCLFSTSTVQPTATLSVQNTATPQPFTVTIGTQQASETVRNSPGSRHPVYLAGLLPISGLALLGLGLIVPRSKRKAWARWFVLTVVVFASVGLISCGGSFTIPTNLSSGGSSGSGGNTPTPAGKYLVIVTITDLQATPTQFQQSSLIIPLTVSPTPD